MNNKKGLYVNILLKDGSMLHEAKLAKNNNPQQGELIISYEDKKEIDELLNNVDNKMIFFTTKYLQGKISTSKMIESYSIIEKDEEFFIIC